MLQVLNYDDFVSKPLSKKLSQMSLNSSQNGPCNVSSNSAVVRDEPECDVQIAILSTSMRGIGPEQCEILQVPAGLLHPLLCAIYTLGAKFSLSLPTDAQTYLSHCPGYEPFTLMFVFHGFLHLLLADARVVPSDNTTTASFHIINTK